MRLPIPWADYSSTRIDESLQRTVNMYPHSKRGYRQFPGLTQFGSAYGNPVFVQEFALDNVIGDLTFNADGTKLFIIVAGDHIDEYALVTAWDITSTTLPRTARYTFSYPSTGFVQGAKWGDSGTKLYAIDSTRDAIYQHTASTAYDVTSLSYASKTFDISGEGSLITGLAINSAGTIFYIITAGDDKIFQYSMTAWDISTGSYSSKEFDISTQIADNPGDITTNPGNTSVFVSGANNTTIYEYTITGDDISTAVLADSLDATVGPSLMDNGITTHAWGNSGKFLYMPNSSDKTPFQWSTPEGYGFGAGANAARNGLVMDGIPYIVIDTQLYSVASDTTLTSIGQVDSSGRCGMETDGVQLVITTATTIYRYTVAGGLVTVTDSNIEDTAKTSAYIDLKFYLDQSEGRFIGSSNNDATTYSIDDRAEAESFADDTLAVYAHNEFLYVMGATSIEPNRSVGVGRPPVDRQVVIERGIVGSFAINSIDDTIYFVDQFTRPNMMSGLEYSPIYTPALAEEWDTYSTVSDCIVLTYVYRQQNFVEFVFPTEDVSWTYHVTSGKWLEREDTSNNRFRAVAYLEAYSTTILLDYLAANLFSFSETTYQDDSVAITRVKDTAIITSEIYGDPALEGRNMSLNTLWLTFQTTGSSSVDVSISKNLSTFTTARTITVASGRSTVKLTSWGKFREAIVRIATTANTGVDIVDIAGDFALLEG